MARKLEIRQGDKYGRLTVLKELEPIVKPNKEKMRKFLCECTCGTRKAVVMHDLRNGHVRSCGCLRRELTISRNKKSNEYLFLDDCVIGYTTAQEIFKIDIDDYEKIKAYCWGKDNAGYISARINGKLVRLHRLVMNPDKKLVVDHINRDKSDNRKSNLRICTQHQNSMNTKAKGYFFNKNTNKWQARIALNGKTISLGSYNTEAEAINARRNGERIYFREFACQD